MASPSLDFRDFPENCACSQLRRAARRLSRYYDLCLATTGLRSTQYTLLGHLLSQGPKTMADLANNLTMDRATIGHNLRPLERDGLIKISVNENDRRMRIVTITRHGHAVFLAAHPAWKKARADFESAFGAHETGYLKKLMTRVIDVPLPKNDQKKAGNVSSGRKRQSPLAGSK